MGRHSTRIDSTAPTASPPSSPRKRKRDDVEATAELEVDITAPEPPSKKSLRRAKRTTLQPQGTVLAGSEDAVEPPTGAQVEGGQSVIPKRSDYGIWIGNLPWTASKATLRDFITGHCQIEDDMITRIHMPTPSKGALATSHPRQKPQNKGFAYIDLSSNDALKEVLALSEKLMDGRRVLIKDSKSFEGRPPIEQKDASGTDPVSGKPPNKRVFVGNLGFDITKEDVEEHLAQCGDLNELHIATFEDSGKCKGYAWVEFTELESAKRAVRGWIEKSESAEVADDVEDLQPVEDDVKPRKKPKARKWWTNKLHGRPLRIEYAEDKAVRYKKRFGKDRRAQVDQASDAAHSGGDDKLSPNYVTKEGQNKSRGRPPRKVDPRDIRPGAALSAAPRQSAAIAESKGTKIVFD